MIEFYAGAGWDTQAIGIALEEMFLDYRVMPGKAALPAIAIDGARLVGPSNILLALARRTNRFLITREEAAIWLSNTPPDIATIETQLRAADFILGRISIADMVAYPRLASDITIRDAHPSISRWTSRMATRSATGRGVCVIAG